MKRFLVILVYCVVLAALLWKSSGIKFDNYEWLAQENPNQVAKDYLNQEFQPGEDLLVGVKLKHDYFSQPVLDELNHVTEQLESLNEVLEVDTPLNATIVLDSQQSIETESYKDALDKNHLPTLESYKQHISDSHYFGQLISKDYRDISIIVNGNINPRDFNFFKREAIIQKVQEILKDSTYLQNYFLSGEMQLSHQMDVQTKDNLSWLLQLSVVLVFIFLYIVYRNIYKIFIIAAATLTTVLSSIVIIVLRGHPLTVVSLMIPIVIIVISIADSIHIITRWDVLRRSINDPIIRLRETMRETWLPCLVTSITTGIGFGVFYFSELIPFQYFGMDAMFIVLTAYVLIVSISWGGIYVFQNKLEISKELKTYSFLTRVLGSIHNFTQDHWKKILYVTLGVCICFTVLLKNIYTETNFLDVFFKKKSDIYKSFTYVDYKLGGSGSVDILLKTDKKGYFKSVDVMMKVQRLEKQLLKHKWVNYTQSYINPVKMVHEEFTKTKGLPKTNDALAQELLFLEFSRGDEEKDILSSYIDFDYSNARIHLQTPNLSANQTKKLLGFINKELKRQDFPGYVYAGSSVFFQVLSGYILETQVLSIGVTLLTIWVLFMLIFGFKLGTLGMIPNIVPILLTLGLISMLRIPFDFATVLISSISFGICVDDSIHFIHYYKYERDKGATFYDRTRNTVRVLGYPLVFTTILLSIGFGVFLTSDLVLLIKFGAFTIFSVVIALISDLIILPAAMRVWDYKET